MIHFKNIRFVICLLCFACLPPSTCQAETLEHLILTALQNHPAIKAQQAHERSAKAGIDSAKWQFYPTPSVNIERVRTRASDRSYPGGSIVSTLRLQQPLWAGGRLTAGVAKAEAGVVASEASLEEVRQQIALRVVQTYGDWFAANLKIQAHEKNLATHVTLREQIRRRIKQGAAAESDLLLVVSRLKSIAADISVARAQQDIALARLGQLLGSPVDVATLAQAAGLTEPRPVNADLQALLDLARSINPTIHKAQAQAKVQEAVIAERRADLSPEVYVRAERQYGNYLYPNAASENRLFIGINSRFGAGLSSLSNVEDARSQHQAALDEIQVQTRNVSEQVLSDYALTASSESRLDAIKASLEAAEKVSESYGRQFLAGRKTWLDVMNAARELAQNEIQLADIRATWIIASWRLAIYTQGIAVVAGEAQ